MKKKPKRQLILITLRFFFVLLIISNNNYDINSSNNDNNGIIKISATHSKIYINGNNQFTSENGVSNPSALGTEGDPFFI